MGYLSAVLATFGQNLVRLREKAGFKTSKSLAEAIGVAPSVVSRWENDRTGLPESPTLLTLATVCRCSIEDLLDGVDPAYEAMLASESVVLGLAQQGDDEEERVDVSGYTRDDIPVIAEGEASPQGSLFWGDDGKLQSDVEDRITRPFDVSDPLAYGVRVRGDSMVPIYRPRMIVIVSPVEPVQSGDEVYVQLLSGERLIKTAKRVPDGWMLTSANPSYEPRLVYDREVGAIHVIVWSRRRDLGRRVVDDAKRTLERRLYERRSAQFPRTPAKPPTDPPTGDD